MLQLMVLGFKVLQDDRNENCGNERQRYKQKSVEHDFERKLVMNTN